MSNTIQNYKVIGSPTYFEGVYSGFSGSNYLAIPTVLKSNSYTYFFKFTTGQDVSTQQYVAHANNFFSLEIANNKAKCWSWDTQTGGSKDLFNVSPNTTYWVKCKYEGYLKTYSHSTDGSTWIQDLQFTDDGIQTQENGYDFRVGLESTNTAYPFLGTVDTNGISVYDEANNALVWSPSTKLVFSDADFIKYGAVSITSDGVASNFSTANAIKVRNRTPATYSKFELRLKFRTGSALTEGSTIIGRGSSRNLTVLVKSNGFFALQISFDGLSYAWTNTDVPAAANTDYDLKVTHDGSTYRILQSTDGGNTYVTKVSYANTNKILGGVLNTLGGFGEDAPLDFGSPWGGTIDLKECYFRFDDVNVWTSKVVEYNPGFVHVAEGYYTDGSKEIVMSPMYVSYKDLLENHQVSSYVNTLYASSVNGTPLLHLVGNGESLKGSYDVSVDLEHPVYLSKLKNYILGDRPRSRNGFTVTFTSKTLTEPATVSLTGTYVVSGSNETFWYPETTTVSLSDQSSALLGDKNYIYLRNSLKDDVASFYLNKTLEAVLSDSTPGPYKYVYLTPAHDDVLAVGSSPDDLSFSTNITYTANYTIKGNATITDGVFTNPSASVYLTRAVGSTTVTRAELTLGVQISSSSDHNWAWSSSANFCLGFDGSNHVAIWDPVTTQTTSGSTVYLMNTPIWVKLVQTSGNFKVYVRYASNVEENLLDLPPLSDPSWSLEVDKNVSVDIFRNCTMYLGNNNKYTPQYFRGTIDLKRCALSINSSQVWVAYAMNYGTYVEASNWTWLNNNTYLVETPSATQTATSALCSTSYESDRQGYLFVRKTVSDPELYGLTSASSFYTNTVTDAYSGFSYKVSSTAGTGIVSIKKTGTRCRVFTRARGAAVDYIFIPANIFYVEGHKRISGALTVIAEGVTEGMPFKDCSQQSSSIFYHYYPDTKILTREDDPTIVFTTDDNEVFIELGSQFPF